nr:MAG TPA: hypothetical protein [Caudoviricetes sp.]
MNQLILHHFQMHCLESYKKVLHNQIHLNHH